MLPERYRKLLTAYVDGELSARRRVQVTRLLRRSREARALLRRLERDSRELKALPAPALEVDLSDSVLERISREQVARAWPRPAGPRAFPAWTGFAAAAAVLLVVGAGSFVYFSSGRGPSGTPPDIGKPPDKDHTRPSPRQLVHKDKTPPGADAAAEPLPEPEEVPDPVVKRIPFEEDPPPPDKAPAPAPKKVLGDRRRDRIELEQVDVPLPSVHWMLDLMEGSPDRKALLKQLGKGRAFHVELPCKDGTRAFERLRAVLTARKVNLVFDPRALLLLKGPSGLRADYALFLEGLSPAEVVDLLHGIGAHDRALARRPAELRLDGHVVVAPLSRVGRKGWADLLGLDPTKPFPKSAGAAPPAPEARPALVLSYSPRYRPSAEVKHFLEARKPLPPGTLQLFVVLRSVP